MASAVLGEHVSGEIERAADENPQRTRRDPRATSDRARYIFRRLGIDPQTPRCFRNDPTRMRIRLPGIVTP